MARVAPMPLQVPLRVGVEATSLLGARTGIGTMTRALLERFGRDERLAVTALVISWRGRATMAASVPPGIRARGSPFPARAAHRLWRHVDWPSVSGFDIVHGPNYVVPPAPKSAEIVSIHDFGPWHDPELVTAHSRAYPELVARAVARGAHVHVDSAFVGREAEDVLAIDGDRVHVVPLGFDAQTEGDRRRGRALAGGHPYVLSLGTIEPRKDLPTLVTAMALVWSEENQTRLVIAGPDGWGTAALEEAIARTGTSERVIRLGYVSDAQRADLLAGASCLAYPSRYEGFGLPPLEAMAASTPVVTTTAGSLPEVVGPAALFVSPGEPAELAAAIDTVLHDGQTVARLVEAGHRQVEQYSWNSMASAMAAVYMDLVGSK